MFKRFEKKGSKPKSGILMPNIAGKNQCNVRTKDGKRCKNKPVRGSHPRFRGRLSSCKTHRKVVKKLLSRVRNRATRRRARNSGK